MIITPWNKRKSEESTGCGHAARGAEMDEASGAEPQCAALNAAFC